MLVPSILDYRLPRNGQGLQGLHMPTQSQVGIDLCLCWLRPQALEASLPSLGFFQQLEGIQAKRSA